MFNKRRRQRAASKVEPGDGHSLKPYRWWQVLQRSMFHLELTDETETSHLYNVDYDQFGWDEKVHLYRGGQHIAASGLPAAFPVPGGAIEVATSTFGLKRMHYVSEDGVARQLTPHSGSGEGLRARFGSRYPTASRWLGIISLVILLIALILGVPQVVEVVSGLDIIADRFGTFTSPIHLPAQVNTTLTVAAILASIERALRLRYNWLLDSDMTDWDG